MIMYRYLFSKEETKQRSLMNYASQRIQLRNNQIEIILFLHEYINPILYTRSSLHELLCAIVIFKLLNPYAFKLIKNEILNSSGAPRLFAVM